MTENKMTAIGVLCGGIGILILSISVVVWGIASFVQSQEKEKRFFDILENTQKIQTGNLPESKKIQRKVDIVLPRTKTKSQPSITEAAIINVRKDGSYFLGAKKVTLREIESKLKLLVKSNPNQACLVRGKKQTSHGQISAVIATCKRAGVQDSNIGYIMTQ